jgi:Protein of unknown function (DUF3592)
MRLRIRGFATGARRAAEGQSISARARSSVAPGCMAGFFSIFLLVGLGFGLFFFVPAYKVLMAGSWSAVDCEIVSSSVGSHSSDDSTTYSVDVSYRYEVDGIEYTGERYEFLGGSSSGLDSKQAKVDALPTGSTTTCYVDPGDPREAVLQRGFSWGYLFALLPLIFIAVGGGGMAWALLGARSAGARRGDLASAQLESGETEDFRQLDAGAERVDSGPIELAEQMSPWGKFGCIVGVAVFWNGIVSVFVWQVWSGWRESGSIDGCLVAFLVPFVGVGLLLVIGVPYQLLALANPRPKLRLSRSLIPLGESAQLDWSFTGSAGRLRDLRIWIEGAESATYRRGTSSTTDTEIFATLEVAERREGSPIATGSATVEIPAETMHSFEAEHNKILWKLKLHASIAYWPDVVTEFPLVVAPEKEEGP